jgi:MFS family permease
MVFLLSLIPGLAAPLAFAWMVRETPRGPARKTFRGALSSLPKPYLRFLAAVGVFGAGDFSPTLLVLAAATLLAPALGPVKAAQLAALLYVARNVVYAAASFPVGALSDVRSKGRLLAAGFLAGAVSAALAGALFARHSGNLLLLSLVFALSGILAAAQDTLTGAIPAELLPADSRGSGFGLLGAVNGAGDLISSALVGTVWSLGSPVAAFSVAAALMALGAALSSYRVARTAPVQQAAKPSPTLAAT